MLTPSDNSDRLDAVYFAATYANVFAKLESAKRSLRYTRQEFESLTSQSTLAPNYRQADAQMRPVASSPVNLAPTTKEPK